MKRNYERWRLLYAPLPFTAVAFATRLRLLRGKFARGSSFVSPPLLPVPALNGADATPGCYNFPILLIEAQGKESGRYILFAAIHRPCVTLLSYLNLDQFLIV